METRGHQHMRGHQWGRHGGSRVLALREKLNLSDKQVARIEEIVKARRAKADSFGPMARARRRLQDAVDQQDEAAVRKAAEQIGKAISQAAIARMRTRAEVRKVLTRDQVKKLDELRAARKKAREERRQAMKKRLERRLKALADPKDAD